jgi:acetyl esterase/lipase
MGKIIFILFLIVIVGTGLWLVRLSGPEQLDLADRLWPGAAEAKGQHSIRNIGYGTLDNMPDAKWQSYDMYFPKGAPKRNDKAKCGDRKYPALIFFHGGSWRDGSKESYGFVGRAFAARGYITFIADYRKMPDHRFPAFVADAARAIGKVHQQLGDIPCADPKRLFVMGHSAGAHIAMMAALDPQWLDANNSNPSIIAGVIGLAGPYDFLPFTNDAARDALGQWPRPEETQPITYARGDAPPLLLLHGADDETVKPRNSERLAQAINSHGGVGTVKIYPKLDHAGIIMAIARPFRKKAPIIRDVIAFTKDIKG